MQDVFPLFDQKVFNIVTATLGASVLGSFSLEMLRRSRSKHDESATAHGSARWASGRDLRGANLFSDEGLLLGRWKGAPLRLTTDRHLLTVAPSRSGKGVSAIIPNLLTYPGSIFVIDPKGENARTSAATRRAMGQRVHILDPWGLTGEASASFNPLDLLHPDDPDLAENAALIADALVPGKGALDPFWEAEAKALLSGLVLYLVTHEPEHAHLPRLRHLLTTREEEVKALLDAMSRSNQAGGLVARLANRMKQKPDRERASVVSSAQSHTHFLDSPRMKSVLSHSDFDPLDLKDRPTTIYLVLPANRLSTYARWLRLIVSLSLAALSDHPSRPRWPVLFILDEFAALGRLDMIEAALGIAAGYGLQLWPIVQDFSQLKDLYGERWNSFIANAGLVQSFGTNDPLTAETLSKLLGTRTLTIQTRSTSLANSQGGSLNQNLIARPLLYPAEIMRMPADRQLLFIGNTPPIQTEKIVYFSDPLFANNQRGRTWMNCSRRLSRRS